MIHTLKIYEELQKSLGSEPAKAITNTLAAIYDDLKNTVTKDEFNELRNTVHELAQSQRELAEAQKRTEARVEELAEAQKRTEARVEELAEAQKRTEARIEELAEAQKRTEEELQNLIKEHSVTRKQLGGLSNTVGYILENEAIKALPQLLSTSYNMQIKGQLKRQFVQDRQGNYIEVNIIGEALKNGKTFTIIGESKTQLSRRGIDEFIRKKLNRLQGVYDNIFPLLVTHMITSPDVEAYAKEKGIALFYSYEF